MSISLFPGMMQPSPMEADECAKKLEILIYASIFGSLDSSDMPFVCLAGSAAFA